MARRKLSEEGRRNISRAAKARWARQRTAKKQGLAVGVMGAPVRIGRPSRNGRRRGRKPGRPAGVGALPAMDNLRGHSLTELVVIRRRIDQELADRYVRQYQA